MSSGIRHNISLKGSNTFHVDATVSTYVLVDNVGDVTPLLEQLLASSVCQDIMVLGGGSNILFATDCIQQPVLHNRISGIRVIDESESYVIVRAMAGQDWHQLVLWSIQQDYGGLENLSLIPGYAGAAPIQNIGAYGVDISHCLQGVETVSLLDGQHRYFPAHECALGYRDSIFKKPLFRQYLILSIDLKLTRLRHRLSVGYSTLCDYLQQQQIEFATIQDVSRAVMSIRRSRLPDPQDLPNAGSFFKNPVIDKGQFDALKGQYSDVSGYALDNGTIKVSAGWLIEQAGWKGKRVGRCGVHQQHALVLVNDGGASGREIFDLACRIIHSVEDLFSITLQPEVTIVR